ncbi:MAG: tail fiber domain-containing protein [Acidobacteriota bacterium]|nr:tail fiber domain-containing protein [Acidobacteriota bacterium]
MKRLLAIVSVAVVAAMFLAPAASAQGVLFVKGDKVGIGIDTPLHDLHVVNTAGSGKDTVAHYVNNGAPEVHFTDTALAVTWQLSPLGNGDFSITKKGTGGAEMIIRQSGQVVMGPGSSTTFQLEPNGDLEIAGTLTENSSRDFKEGFAALDGREILAQVADLPVIEWSYKNQESRHIGPMAEDFHSAFGLGLTNKGLAPRDLAGVTLAALQGLNEVVEEKDSEIEQLRRELAELRSLVESVTSR